METISIVVPSQHEIRSNSVVKSDIQVTSIPLSMVDEVTSLQSPGSDQAESSSYNVEEHHDYIAKMNSHQSQSYDASKTSRIPLSNSAEEYGVSPTKQGSDAYQRYDMEQDNGERDDSKIKRKTKWLLSGILGKDLEGEEEEEDQDSVEEQGQEQGRDLERKSTRQSSKSSKSNRSDRRKSSPEARRWEERY